MAKFAECCCGSTRTLLHNAHNVFDGDILAAHARLTSATAPFAQANT